MAVATRSPFLLSFLPFLPTGMTYSSVSLTMMTPAAPASWALRAFSIKWQSPRSMSTILPNVCLLNLSPPLAVQALGLAVSYVTA